MVIYPLNATGTDIQIDDPTFVNNNVFSITLNSLGLPLSDFPGGLYETTDTLNYTNRGYMFGFPGFKFHYFPAVPPSAPEFGLVIRLRMSMRMRSIDPGLICCTRLSWESCC